MNTTFAVAVPVAFLLGASLSGLLIAGRVALTETAPAGQHGRVFAVQLTLTETAISVPLLALGLGTTYAGARITLAGLALLVAGCLALAELDRARAAFGRRAAAIEPGAATSAGA
jgi:MFS-type transporter involved in bile tolerance (Atg22 family)